MANSRQKTSPSIYITEIIHNSFPSLSCPHQHIVLTNTIMWFMQIKANLWNHCAWVPACRYMEISSSKKSWIFKTITQAGETKEDFYSHCCNTFYMLLIGMTWKWQQEKEYYSCSLVGWNWSHWIFESPLRPIF